MDKNPSIESNINTHCVLVLPQQGHDLPQDYEWGYATLSNGRRIFITPVVGDALDIQCASWTIIAPQEWQASTDDIFEAVRIQDVARALAAASTAPMPPALIDGRNLSHGPSHDEIMLARESLDLFSAPEGAGARLPPQLSMYSYGPPRPGAGAEVSLACFKYAKPQVHEQFGAVTFSLSGRGGLLLWGPHIALSPGRWLLSARIESRKHGGAVSLKIEWGDMTSFTSLDCDIHNNGRHKLTIGHDWIATSPCELRVTLAHPIFDCDLEVSDIRIERE